MPFENTDSIFKTYPKLKEVFKLLKQQKFEEAKKEIEAQINQALAKNSLEEVGYFYSASGVLFTLLKDDKKAYKAYQTAEKHLPQDMSLKMINVRFLTHTFHQFDLALTKLNVILKETKSDAVMQHHALALLSLTYFMKGDKAKAKDNFQKLIGLDFKKLRSSSNLDYKTCEAFLGKNFEKELCLDYLTACLKLAESLKEKTMVQVLSKLKKAFLPV